MTFLTAAAASWISWGFGLVVGAVLAREVARQVRVDFAWLVAAAYSGFVIYASGPSGSIPLSQASHGNALNIVEKVTGHIVPFGQSIFAPFNLVPMLLDPAGHAVRAVAGAAARRGCAGFCSPAGSARCAGCRRCRATIARKIETSPVGTIFLVLAGIGYAVVAFSPRARSISTSISSSLFF